MQTLDPSNLSRRALRGSLVFSAALLSLILLPAGSVRYWQGWLFWLHFTAWTVGLTVYFLTVDVAAGQKVISSGPYALVRHPMYSGALLMFIGAPLALGSWWGLVPVLLLAGGVVARLQDEEVYLDRNLHAYDAYRRQVHHRLVPGVW